MSRRISIGWFRQRSGRYALKGITISEGDLSYDAASTFREEDARWLTWMLGARANIEISGSNGNSMRSQEDYPEWARDTGMEFNGDVVTPLDRERAGAAIFRHLLVQLLEADCTEANSAARQKLANEAQAAFLATDSGTHYSLEHARTILDKLDPKSAARKVKK